MLQRYYSRNWGCIMTCTADTALTQALAWESGPRVAEDAWTDYDRASFWYAVAAGLCPTQPRS